MEGRQLRSGISTGIPNFIWFELCRVRFLSHLPLGKAPAGSENATKLYPVFHKLAQHPFHIFFPSRNNHAELWIKNKYNNKFIIGEIAKNFKIAPSSIYKYFKTVSSLISIQCQKLLCLSEDRRLLDNGSIKAAEVAENIGYESSTQIGMEHSRLYEIPLMIYAHIQMNMCFKFI